MKKQFFLPLFLFSCSSAFAQLQVKPQNNADSLVTVLAGGGLTFSNATLNCSDTASGTFNGITSNIGLTSGILLTTGNVYKAVGPNISSAISDANGVTFNDADLMAIDPLAVNDVCILEFDAVPVCDTIFVKFAFGSDEYPEFVNSTYNDAFGIFVTGPNPSGPAYAGYNLTTIPLTTTPVSINNVSNGTLCPTAGPCVNCAYYIDNCAMGPPSTVEYDGFTKVISKSIAVVPSQSYHFKYAIADAGDQGFDSGVFFEVGSFSCLSVNVSSTPDTCGTADGTATAYMSGGIQPVTYLWSNGQTGQTATGLAAGTYSVSVTDSTNTTLTTMVIVNNSMPGAVASQTAVSCFGGSNGAATASVTGGIPPLTYLWSNGQTTQTATGLTVGSYSVIISDATGCSTTVNTTIAGSPLLISNLNYTPTSCTTCPDGSAYTNAVGGVPPYTYKWTPGNQTTPTIVGQLPGSYTVCITDANNCKRCDSVAIWTVGVSEYISQFVTVFPNPSSGAFVVDFGNKNFGSTGVVFTDLTGRVILETNITASGKQAINVSPISSGIYFLKLTTEQGVAVRKITITR